jgi:hypothetical protein
MAKLYKEFLDTATITNSKDICLPNFNPTIFYEQKDSKNNARLVLCPYST